MQVKNLMTIENVVTSSIDNVTYTSGRYEFQKKIKRTIDIVFALSVIILICFWLIPIVALLIKINSKGPVFFLQERIGLDNSIFRCWKLRTMYSDSHVSFKATEKKDSRVTPVGRILRKLNIDELPQVVNVLMGDMSLVGPRPQAVPFYHEYKEFIEDLDLRHVVKPGITGWAQIKGLRGDSPDEDENRRRIWQRFECDMWYIENWSVKLDIEIIFKTALIVIKGDSNAY